MQARLVAPAAILLLLLSGCLGGGTAPDAGPAGNGATAELATDPGPEPWRLHLTPDLRLTEVAPTEGSPVDVAVPTFYDRWVAGSSWPQWWRTVEEDVRITHANLSFHYRSETATATTGPQDQGFPEFVVYLGVGDAFMGWASVSGPDLATDEPVGVEASLELPRGGLMVRAGEHLSVLIVPVQGSTGNEDRVTIVTNSTETPSVLEATVEPTSLPRVSWDRTVDETVQLVGSAYVTQEAGTSSQTLALEVPVDALGVRVHIARTGGVGGADMDVTVRDPSGEVVAVGVTPRPVEDVRLLDQNLAGAVPGTWSIEVVQYGGAVADVDVVAWIGRPATTGI